MKGKIVIESEGKRLHMSGTMMLNDEIEKYELISTLSKCLGVNDAKSWAECVLYCLSRIDDQEGLRRTEISIPNFGGERE